MATMPRQPEEERWPSRVEKKRGGSIVISNSTRTEHGLRQHANRSHDSVTTWDKAMAMEKRKNEIGLGKWV